MLLNGAKGDLGQGKYTVTLIEGDGIGPEISQSVKDIFAAAKVCKHLDQQKDKGKLKVHRLPSNGNPSMLLLS
jgi:isocitrate/isopropylmalate dehydrogenase